MVWRSSLDWKWRTCWSRLHRNTWAASSHLCQNAKMWMLSLGHLYTELDLLWYLKLTSCLSVHNCRITSRNCTSILYTESKYFYRIFLIVVFRRINTLRTGDADLRFLHYNYARRMTQICVCNTRLCSLHNTLNYVIHRACFRMVLLTDVYRNLTSLWINL